MKTFKQFIEEAAAPSKKIVSATGINGTGKTTVTYEDGTSEVLTGPRPIRNNNPGNLEYGPFARSQGAVGSDGRYAVFPTKEAGWQAKVNLLKTNTYQSLSIKDAFNRYAPPSENPNYLRDLQQRTGFDLNRQMSSLSEDEFRKLIDAVAIIEGAGQYVGQFSTVAPGSVPDYTSTPGSTETSTPEPEQEPEEYGTIWGALKGVKDAVKELTGYGKST